MRIVLFLALALLPLVAVGVGPSQTVDCLDIVTPPTADLPDGLKFPEVTSALPPEVTFAKAQTLENDQKAFDLFSWASFVALNWPADKDGKPFAGKLGDHPDAPRVWETYITAAQVFKKDGAKPDPWGGENSVARARVPDLKKDERVLFSASKDVLSEVLQAGFGTARFPPIADVNGNYAFYEIHLNRVEYDYIVEHDLYSKDGQSTFLQATPPGKVAFPQGSGGAQPKQGSIELKAAWKQLGKGDDEKRFYTIRAIRVDPKTGQPSQDPVPFGLVGLHIVTRTQQAPQWIWSTFEHVDNAPDVGEKPLKDHYNFNDAKPGNQPAAGYGFRPPDNKPVANPTTPTQITRVLNNQLINAPWTKGLNAEMQKRVAGTVWANYRLVTTQWPSGGQFIPCHVTNTVGETYIQGDPFQGSCMRCHNVAQTSGVDKTGRTAPANFSYLLLMAQPLPAKK